MMYLTKSAAYFAVSVILLVLPCDGCYTNYNTCQQQYITAAGAAGSSGPSMAQQQLCGAATTAMTCLNNDAANCPPGTVEPADFTQIKTSINQTVINCELSNSCFRKVSQCANYSTEITDIVMSINFTDPSSLQSLSSMMCPTFDKITKCYSELTSMCPDPAFANATASLDAVKPLIAQICGNARGTQNGCQQKSLECRSISQKILSINFSDTPALQNLAPLVCTTMTNVTTCYNRLKEDCPNLMPADLTSPVDAMKPMLDQMCGAGENCLGCVTPVMDFDCQNTSKEDYEGIYRCCVVSYEMFNCLKRNQCTQRPMFGDIQLFQSAIDGQCTGYQEYCPGLNGCLSSFNTNPDLYKVCPQISSFMTCVNTACKDKPKVGDLTIMKIMPLYQQICTGLNNYPAIATCPTFGTCTQNGVSALIPQPVTLKSISAVGNPEHWCNSLKSILKCTTAYSQPCNQTTTVTHTLTNLLNKVKVHCPDEGDVGEITTVVTTGGGNAGISVESSLMLILVVSSAVSFD